MLGENRRSERMFYYVRTEDIVPENHLLRLIDRHIDLKFVRGKVKHLYSPTGRPSVDPEVLLRMLLIGYLYGITSERRLCKEVQMHRLRGHIFKCQILLKGCTGVSMGFEVGRAMHYSRQRKELGGAGIGNSVTIKALNKSIGPWSN